jgi:hypothetical protein
MEHLILGAMLTICVYCLWNALQIVERVEKSSAEQTAMAKASLDAMAIILASFQEKK